MKIFPKVKFKNINKIALRNVLKTSLIYTCFDTFNLKALYLLVIQGFIVEPPRIELGSKQATKELSTRLVFY